MTALVRRSKAHWGYSDAFLAHFAPSLAVGPRTLARGGCWVAARGARLAGYVACRGARLEDLFVAPEAMGMGLGRLLLARAGKEALAAGHRWLVLDSDPFAAAFYRRLGARTVGWTPSPWPGDPARRLPRMRLPLRLPLPPGRRPAR